MIEIKKLKGSLVEIKGEIEAAIFENARPAAVKRLGMNLEVDGFRKGNAPPNLVEKNIGEMVILEAMAEITLSKKYPEIIKENNLEAIGYPKINITKLAKGNPLGFTITIAVLPEIKLPDYRKIAADINKKEVDTEVTDKEFEATINQVRTMRAKELNKGVEIKSESELPPLDNEYVKKLGAFEDVEDFKKKVRVNIGEEKKHRAAEKKRLEIMEGIIEKSELEVPEVIVHSELHKMLGKMKSDVEGMGLKYEDYLKSIKKTEDDLEKEWQSDAEKRAKLQLVVGEIAKAEKISAPKEKVDAELKKVLENYKDADPENARVYIESVFQNEEVFKFLEAQK